MVEEKIVEVTRSPIKGYGFSIIGGSNTHLPPMISFLAEEGPAALSNQIHVGDVIQKVNGTDVRKLRAKEIKSIIHNSEGKVVLALVQDSQAKKLANPYLSERLVIPKKADRRSTKSSANSLHSKSVSSTKASKLSSREVKYSLNESEASRKWDIESGTELEVNSNQNSSIQSDERTGGEKLSPRYQRTVGSPGYDRLGADGKFSRSGSLNAAQTCFSFVEDIELTEGKETPSIDSCTPSCHENSSTNSCDQQPGLPSSDEAQNRLSRPLFGSAPRLHEPTSSRAMKQISHHSNVQQLHKRSRDPPLFHRRSASHDEQTLNFVSGQQQYLPGIGHRTQLNPTIVTNSDINRVARTGQAVRFHGNLNQSLEGPEITERTGAMSNGLTVRRSNSNTEVRSSSNAQELRNAFIRHQLALRAHKPGGFSQRRYNSNEELPMRDHSINFIRQNGLTPNKRPALLEKNFVGNHVAIDGDGDDDYDDMQESGYGVGFRRTNSLGKADTLNITRNQDFVFNDVVHRSQYTNQDELTRGLQMSHLSPALQQRLKNATSSMGVTSSIGTNFVTTLRGSSPFDNYGNAQTDTYVTNQFGQREEDFLANSPRTEDFASYSNASLGDTEDGMVHSRYEHGKSLAVPTQQYPEDFLSLNAGENIDVYGKARGSFSFRHSIGSRPSEAANNMEIMPRTVIPTELKTVDATDLATRLFTLDGFTSDEVAPFLGKNTDFSQHVCNEYMKFFNFEGFAIDEALRTLLQKFPVTGETQERERILLQFSKRYHECNGQLYGSEDAVHTLTCALMLLNTDLHGQNIGTKMTTNDFVNNLAGMCDGQDFSRELLKTLYQSIKSKEIQYAASEVQKEMKPSPKIRKPSSNGNPFIELKAHDDAVVMRKGMMLRKCIMETDGKRLPAMKRRWKAFMCTLKGLVLFLQKPEKGQGDYSIGIHHSLAGFASEYKKKPFVFKLITADWRVFMFEAKNKADVQEWVDCINLSASALSSPPLPAPCSSSKQFTRPVMPVSVTKLSLDEQFKRHSERVESIETDMREHREIQPDESSKDFKEWENKMDYLEFEYKRFSAYAKVLCMPRLKEKLLFLLSNRNKLPPTRMEEAPSNIPLRSSSMNDIGNSHNSSPATRRRMRQSYLQAIHH